MFDSSESNIYFFIANSLAWTNEQAPPVAEDTVKFTEFDAWDNMLSLKKVGANNVSYVARRVDWTSNTRYAKYNDSNNTLYGANYYVFTDDYNVYKCIDNNNNAYSTAKPTGTSTSPVITADGFVWKYMYTVTAAKALSFLTSNFIPVQTLASDDGTTQWDIQQAAIDGGIESYSLDAGGSSYRGATGTAQAGASTTITLASDASSVNSYYNGCSVYVSGGTGSGQLRKITAYNGTTKVATVSVAWSTNPNTSSTYIIGPTVEIIGSGTGAKAYSTVNSGVISKIVPIDSGTGYKKATVVVSASAGSGASVRAMLSPLGGHGYNPVAELGASNVMLNIKLVGNETNTFTTNNEFRTIGLMSTPKLLNNTVANAASYDMSYKFTVGTVVGNFLKDEFVRGGTSNAYGYVVDFKNGDTLRLTNLNGTFSNGETLTGNTTSTTANITNITAPSIKKYSGDIIYIENRSPVTRSEDQTEDLRVVVAL